MTDAQLQVLLSGMVAELSATIDGAREAMPADAEREKIGAWRLKPEYAGKLVFLPSVDMQEHYTVDGDYLALLPLVALRDAWQERIELLKSERETT